MTAIYSGIVVDDSGNSTWPLGAYCVFDEPPAATLSGASNTAIASYRNRLLLLDPGGTAESFSQFFIPLNATVPFPIGTRIRFFQTTDGIMAINGVAGVTVTTQKSMQLLGIGARATVEKIATNTWILYGDLMPPSRGITQWNDSISFYTSVNGGILGSTSGFWVAMLVTINAQTLNLTRFVMSKFTGAGIGYIMRSVTTNSAVDFAVCFTPAGGLIGSPAYNPVANDIGKLFLVVGIYDATANLLRLYVNNAQVGAGTNVAGQTYAPAPTQRTTLARRSDVGANSCPDWTIYGVTGGDAFIPTNAEVLNLFTRVKATGDIQPIPSKTTRLWSLRRQFIRGQPVMWLDSQNTTAPNNLGMGTATWSPGGTTSGQSPADLTFVETLNPVFSW